MVHERFNENMSVFPLGVYMRIPQTSVRGHCLGSRSWFKGESLFSPDEQLEQTSATGCSGRCCVRGGRQTVWLAQVTCSLMASLDCELHGMDVQLAVFCAGRQHGSSSCSRVERLGSAGIPLLSCRLRHADLIIHLLLFICTLNISAVSQTKQLAVQRVLARISRFPVVTGSSGEVRCAAELTSVARMNAALECVDLIFRRDVTIPNENLCH